MAIDLFISHASEDKEQIARPLADELRSRGRRVWFDESELTLGDSLAQVIDRGLAEARFGVVILSPDFFAKAWPQRELDGLTAREMAHKGRKVILPIWHHVDHDYVLRFSPPLAGRLAASSTIGIPAIADQIERVLAGVPVDTAIRNNPDPPTAAAPRYPGVADGLRWLGSQIWSFAGRWARSHVVRRTLIVVLAAAAVLAGFLTAGGGTAAQRPAVVRGGALNIPYDGTWQLQREAKSRSLGLELSNPATLRHADFPASDFTVGELAKPPPAISPIPAELRRAVATRSSLRAQLVGGLEAVALHGRLRDGGSAAVYMVPTTVGWAVMACRAARGPQADAFLRACRELARHAEVAGARAQSVLPDANYADAVATQLLRAAAVRRSQEKQLGARSLAKRARAASHVSRSYGRAAAALERTAVGLRQAQPHRLLVRAMRSLENAFARLATASRERRSTAYRAARSAAAAADRRVRAALNDLGNLGYRLLEQ